MKVKYLYSLHYCYGKSAGAHLSVLQTPDRWVALKPFQLLLSTESICPSSVNSVCCLIWSCPLRRGCPLWGRRSKVCLCPTFPSSNPQIRGLSVAECWAVCLLTLSHRLNLYKQGVFTLLLRQEKEAGQEEPNTALRNFHFPLQTWWTFLRLYNDVLSKENSCHGCRFNNLLMQ